MPSSQEISVLQLYQQANIYLAKQQFSEAIAACKTALEHQPNFAPAYKIIGTIEQLQGAFDNAENSYKKALAIDPNFAEVYANLGSLFAQKNEWESAIAAYESAIKIKPDFGGAYRNLAKVFSQISQSDKATYCWLKSVSIEPDRLKIQDYIDLGETLENQGNFSQAIAVYLKAMEIYPNLAEMPYKLGESFSKCQQWEKAITAYKKSIEINPDLYYVHSRLGDIFLELKNYQEAITAYKKSIEIKPDLYYVYSNLGDALVALESHQEAITAYEESIKLKNDLHWLNFKLAELWKKQGNIKQAIAAYKQGISLQPELVWPYFKLIELLNKLEQWDDIIDTYQQLLKVYQDNPLKIYNTIAELAVKLKNWDQAITNYQKVIELNPESFNACLQLAQIFVQQKQPLNAIEIFIKAINIKPYFHWSYWNLWNLLEEHNKLDVVIDIYRQKLSDFSDFHVVDLNLGEALSCKGEIEESISHYRNSSYKKSLKIQPEIVNQYWDNTTPCPPNFLIVGAQKGGTTSLYNYLSKHPQVLPSIKKEVYFWNLLFYRGLDWYLSHFPHLSPESKCITGEATPHYLESQEVPHRVFEIFPSIKIIVLLRNPIIRSLSHYHHWMRLMWEKRSWQEAFASELEIMADPQNISFNSTAVQSSNKYIFRGMYLLFLKNWLSVFPQEQLLILRSEDFYENPQTIFNQVLEFLELPSHQLDKYHPFNAGEYAVNTDDKIYQQMQNFFQPHNQELEEFLGTKLNW